MKTSHLTFYFLNFFFQKILTLTILPVLEDHLKTSEFITHVLSVLISFMHHSSEDDYKCYIAPLIHSIISKPRPIPATIYILEKLEVLLVRSNEEEIKNVILPMVFNTLESNNLQGQEAAINVFAFIKQYTDNQTIRKILLPKAKTLFLKSTNVRVKVNALACISKLVDTLDKTLILDEVLPFLIDIKEQDTEIIVCIISKLSFILIIVGLLIINYCVT